MWGRKDQAFWHWFRLSSDKPACHNHRVDRRKMTEWAEGKPGIVWGVCVFCEMASRRSDQGED